MHLFLISTVTPDTWGSKHCLQLTDFDCVRAYRVTKLQFPQRGVWSFSREWLVLLFWETLSKGVKWRESPASLVQDGTWKLPNLVPLSGLWAPTVEWPCQSEPGFPWLGKKVMKTNQSFKQRSTVDCNQKARILVFYLIHFSHVFHLICLSIVSNIWMKISVLLFRLFFYNFFPFLPSQELVAQLPLRSARISLSGSSVVSLDGGWCFSL